MFDVQYRIQSNQFHSVIWQYTVSFATGTFVIHCIRENIHIYVG